MRHNTPMTLNEVIDMLISIRDANGAGELPVYLDANDGEYVNPVKSVMSLDDSGAAIIYDSDI